MQDDQRQFAIITGSGFSSFGEEAQGRTIETAYGPMSAPLRDLRYGDRRVLLLGRHGDDMRIPPHRINYRANLAGLKQAGTTDVIAINTVGVIRKEMHPGQLAVPAQLSDYTWGREHSFCDGTGDTPQHIDFTQPLSMELRELLLQAAHNAGIECHDGGVYAVMQGPRLETAAEVDRLERDGADFIGMTALPEAALARELGVGYAMLSLIVNYAAGRGDTEIHADIEASTVSAKLQAMHVLRQFFDRPRHDTGAGSDSST